MIERLLPSWVSVAETRVDFGLDELFPVEIEAISRAVAKRRAEYSTVRACARQALGGLGVPPAPILSGRRGAPSWPDGVVGSMTHCAGYRAAVVARADQAHGVGIDAEPAGPLPEGVIDVVASAAEQAHLATLPAGGPWDRLLFCIKESVYKTWFPLTGEWLDFSGAEVRIDPSDRSFRAELQVPGPSVDGVELTGFTGRFLLEDELVLAAIVLPRQ